MLKFILEIKKVVDSGTIDFQLKVQTGNGKIIQQVEYQFDTEKYIEDFSQGIIVIDKKEIFKIPIGNCENNFVFHFDKDGVLEIKQLPNLEIIEIKSELDLTFSGVQVYRNLKVQVPSLRIKEDSYIYTINSNINSTKDLVVKGQYLVEHELKIDVKGNLQIQQEGKLLSKNRAYVYIDGMAFIDGIIGSRVWFKFHVKSGKYIKENGRIVTKGYAFLDSLFMENKNQISAMQHLNISSSFICNNSTAVLESKNTAYFNTFQSISNFGDITSEKMLLNSENNVINQPQAKIIAGNLTIYSPYLSNKAVKCSEQALSDCQDFKQMGVIAGKEQLNVKAHLFDNFGLVLSYESINIRVVQQLNNLMGAYILAYGPIKNKSKLNILNVGQIISKSVVDFKAKEWLKNISGGKLSAPQINILSKELENAGSLSADKYSLHVAGLIHQLITGKIKAKETLEILSGEVINEGIITCCSKIQLDVKKLINHGNISADSKIILLSLSVIENTGNISALKEIKMVAKQILQSVQTGSIVSKSNIVMLARFSLENAGTITCEELDLEVTNGWIKNLEDATISVINVNLQAVKINNSGKIQARRIMAKANALIECSSTGLIKASELMQLTADKIENFGTITCLKNICVDARRLFKNYGTIASNDQLALVFASIIENCGTITSLGELKIRAGQALHNLKSGTINSANDIELLVKFALDNSGTIAGKNVKILMSKIGDVTENRISAKTEVLLRNLEQGLITAKEAVLIDTQKIINSGTISACKSLTADVADILNQPTGVISSGESLSFICASILENSGKIKATENIKIVAQKILQTVLLEQGLGEIISRDLELIAEFAIENAGVISGNNITAIVKQKESFIKNLIGAKILGEQNIKLESGNLQNSGLIKSSSGIVDLRTQILLENFRTGVITAKELIDIKSGKLDNHGLINSAKSLQATIEQITNYDHGELSSEDKVIITCVGIIDNFGKIGACSELVIEAKKLLQQASSGTIVSDDHIKFIIEEAILNAGIIAGDAVDIVLSTADSMVENLENAQILAKQGVEISGDKLSNSGEISSENSSINIKTKVLLENLDKGIITAKEAVDLISGNMKNGGEILAKSGKFILENTFKNTGKINITKNLTIDSKNTLELLRSGQVKIGGALALLSKQKVFSEADLFVFSSLSVIAPTFEQANGNINANENIDLQVADWILKGEIKAVRNLTAKVSNNWTWDRAGKFDACNTVKLSLDKGRTFADYDLNVNNLIIESNRNANFQILKNITATGSININSGKVQIGAQGRAFTRISAGNEFISNCVEFDNVYGGVYGHNKIGIYSDRGITNGRGVSGIFTEQRARQFTENINGTVSNGSFLATSGNAVLNATRGNVENLYGEMNFLGNCDVTASGRLHNLSGTFRTGGLATLKVNHTLNEMLHSETWSDNKKTGSGVAQSKAPIFNAGGVNSYGNFISKGGIVNVKQNINFYSGGGYQGTDYETFEYWTTTYEEKGHRKHGVGHRVRYTREQENKRVNAKYSSTLNVGQNFTGTNPGNYKLSGANIGGNVDLKFTNFTIEQTVRTIELPTTVKRINNTSDYFDINDSQLYSIISDLNSKSVITATVPFIVNNHYPTEYAILSELDQNNINHTKLRNKFCPQKEAELITDILAKETGSLIISDNLLVDLIKSGVEYQKSLGVNSLTSADILAATCPMYVYKIEIFNGEPVKVGQLILPAGKPLHFGVRAKNMKLQGERNPLEHAFSMLKITGNVKVENNFNFDCDVAVIEQGTVEDFTSTRVSRRRDDLVKTIKANPGTGIVEATTITGNTKYFHQIGAEIKSGAGGTNIITEEANFSPLRTTSAISSNCNYTIKPDFTAAKQTSEGDITILADKITGSGVNFNAKGILELRYNEQLSLLLCSEYYNLPIEEKKKLFHTKISGGTEVSNLENFLHGGQGIIMHSATGSTVLQNVDFSGSIPTYNLDLAKFIEESLNPQGEKFSYKKMNLLGQAAVLAAAYFVSPLVAGTILPNATGIVLTISEGAISSGISNGLSVKDIVKGMIQGAGLEGIVGTLDSGIKEMTKMHKFLKPVISSAAKAGASSIITGSDFKTGFISNMVNAGIKQRSIDPNSNLYLDSSSAMISSALLGKFKQEIFRSGVLSLVQSEASRIGSRVATRGLNFGDDFNNLPEDDLQEEPINTNIHSSALWNAGSNYRSSVLGLGSDLVNFNSTINNHNTLFSGRGYFAPSTNGDGLNYCFDYRMPGRGRSVVREIGWGCDVGFGNIGKLYFSNVIYININQNSFLSHIRNSSLVLAGLGASVADFAIDSAKFILSASAYPEEFNQAFNPYVLTSESEKLQARIFKDSQEKHQTLLYVVNNPAEVAKKVGSALWDISKNKIIKIGEEASAGNYFTAGKDQGHVALTAGLLTHSGKLVLDSAVKAGSKLSSTEFLIGYDKFKVTSELGGRRLLFPESVSEITGVGICGIPIVNKFGVNHIKYNSIDILQLEKLRTQLRQ